VNSFAHAFVVETIIERDVSLSPITHFRAVSDPFDR
jgi:hypothetical protein